MISLVVFSGVILALAGMAYQVARRSTRATDQALVMGTLLGKADRASSAAYDSLPGLAGCDTTHSGAVDVVACTTVTTLSSRVSEVLIVVSINVPGGLADSLTLTRSKQRQPIPLQ